jgi:hypothetical protein
MSIVNDVWSTWQGEFEGALSTVVHVVSERAWSGVSARGVKATTSASTVKPGFTLSIRPSSAQTIIPYAVHEDRGARSRPT